MIILSSSFILHWGTEALREVGFASFLVELVFLYITLHQLNFPRKMADANL